MGVLIGLVLLIASGVAGSLHLSERHPRSIRRRPDGRHIKREMVE